MKKKLFRRILTASALAFFAGIAVFILTAEISLTELIVPLVLAVVVFLTISFIVARAVSAGFIKPFEDLTPENRDEVGYEEINSLIDKIGRQNQLITNQMAEIRRRQVEFKAITENMSEGFILLDKKSEIISYNKSALSILGAHEVNDGEHFIALNRSHEFVSAVGSALEGRHSDYLITLGQKVYKVFANPVTADGETSGVVIVILDITETKKREEIRQEFTSNVSHELRTPLTSISGISELLMNGMVKEEDIPKFSKNIHDEAGRLIGLVNDIIKLSRLDEGRISSENEQVDLEQTVLDIKEKLNIIAKKRNVTFITKTEPIVIDANRSVLNEMIYNLCDNAIKYNMQDGFVTVTVGLTDGKPSITVADTGIGIPPEHIDRVFERFYRVDKSHSKEIGGTGLGLSIVKHAAEYLGATLHIESQENIGTEVSITFNI